MEENMEIYERNLRERMEDPDPNPGSKPSGKWAKIGMGIGIAAIVATLASYSLIKSNETGIKWTKKTVPEGHVGIVYMMRDGVNIKADMTIAPEKYIINPETGKISVKMKVYKKGEEIQSPTVEYYPDKGE